MPKTIGVTFFVNDEYFTTVPMPRDASFESLRQRWREASGDTGPACFLLDSLDGAELPDEGRLEDIVPPRKGGLVLHVLRGEEKSVRIFGCQMERIPVRLFPTETTEGLTERIKDLVGVEEGRVARLLSGGRVLDAEVPPCVQLAERPCIDLDLQVRFLGCFVGPAAFHPVLHDDLDRIAQNKDLTEEARREAANPTEPDALPAFTKDPDVRSLRLFASEPARSLCGPGERRAVAFGSGVTIDGDEAVAALVAEETLLTGAVTGVVVERRMVVHVEEKLQRRLRTQSVWPSMKLDHFVTNVNDCVLIEGERADPCQSLWEAGLQSGCCLSLTRFISLTVFNEGTVTKVSADLGEPLLDLRERLSMPEDAFDLWCEGEMLRGGERSLAELQVDGTAVLVALPKSRAVQLKMSGAEPVRLGAVRKTTSFRAFLQTAAEALRTPLPRKTRFVCTCGRVFSNENVQRREFPLHCCRASELRLTVLPPPKNQRSQTVHRTKEASCQVKAEARTAKTRRRRMRRRAKTQTDNSRHHTKTQTDNSRHHTKTQTDNSLHHTETQTDNSVDRYVAQVHEEPPSSADFRIWWRFDRRREVFDLRVPFRGAPRGRDLRAAIAEARGVAAGDLRLLQIRTRRKRDGAVVVDVGKVLPEFADEQGEAVPEGECNAQKGHEISDDDAVPTAGPLRLRIIVKKK